MRYHHHVFVPGTGVHRIVITGRGAIGCLDHDPKEVSRTLTLVAFGSQDLCPCLKVYLQLLELVKTRSLLKEGYPYLTVSKPNKPRPALTEMNTDDLPNWVRWRLAPAPEAMPTLRRWLKGVRLSAEELRSPANDSFDVRLVKELTQRGHYAQVALASRHLFFCLAGRRNAIRMPLLVNHHQAGVFQDLHVGTQKVRWSLTGRPAHHKVVETAGLLELEYLEDIKCRDSNARPPKNTPRIEARAAKPNQPYKGRRRLQR